MKFPICHCIDITNADNTTYNAIYSKMIEDGYTDPYPKEDWTLFSYVGVNGYGDIMRYNIPQFYLEDYNMFNASAFEIENVIHWTKYINNKI